MAVYVTSDLHGLALEDLQRLLEQAGFSERDFLFILGDVIDRRGDGGIGVLRWLLCQPNVQLLMGNHEAMLLTCDFVFEEITEQSLSELTQRKLELWQHYTHNGGDVTLRSLRQLGRDDPAAVRDVLEYLRECPLYETVTAGGQDYLLVHGGLGNFHPDKRLADYTAEELLWCRPALEESYFTHTTTVLGHTPTAAYGSSYAGRILHTSTWIDVDVGVTGGYPPALLRLDDRQEFYLEP